MHKTKIPESFPEQLPEQNKTKQNKILQFKVKSNNYLIDVPVHLLLEQRLNIDTDTGWIRRDEEWEERTTKTAYK